MLDLNADYSNLSDEDYVIAKARETKHIPTESKAWMLTAKSLFPENFDVHYEAYMMEKTYGNLKEAAKSFASLFQSFVAENRLSDEIHALTNALLTEDDDPNAEFLRDMFEYIPPSVQHDLLTVTAEKSEDTMEHCQIMLLLFQKFSQPTPQLILRLLETLITAEKHGHFPSVVNRFRKTLVCDVMPLLFQSTSDFSSKQLYRFLNKTLEFYIAYFMSRTTKIENVPDSEPKPEITWDSLFEILLRFGKKMEWELCTIFAQPWNRTVAFRRIKQFMNTRIIGPDAGKAARQMIYCLTVLFSNCLYQYNMRISPDEDYPLVMVSGELYAEEKSETPPTRLSPAQLLNGNQRLPLIIASDKEVVSLFGSVLHCWCILNSNEVFQKEYSKLKQHIHLDVWMHDFLCDVCVYCSLHKELLRIVTHTNPNCLRSMIHKVTCHAMLEHFEVLNECCIQIVNQIKHLPSEGGCNNEEEAKNGIREVFFLPLTKRSVLQFVVKILLFQYTCKLDTVDQNSEKYDRLLGYLIILSQYNWPYELKTLEYAFNIVMELERPFMFPLFYKYIVVIDLLEMFLECYKHQNGSELDLGLGPDNGTKTDQKNINKMTQLVYHQMSTEHNRDDVIIQFILEEELTIEDD